MGCNERSETFIHATHLRTKSFTYKVSYERGRKVHPRLNFEWEEDQLL